MTPCGRCGGEKEEGLGRGARLCLSCRETKEAERLCMRCGEHPKVAGRGYRLCAACERVRPSKNAPRPCCKCGKPKPKPQGRKWCDDCVDVVAWAAQRRKKARATLKRKPCKTCRGSKGPGHSPYCPRCRAERAKPRLCRRCEERPVTAKAAKNCERCRAMAPQRIRAYQAARLQRKRETEPGFRERERRLKRESKRRAQERARRRPRVNQDPSYEVPAGPLWEMLQTWIEKQRPIDFVAMDPAFREFTDAALFERLGVAGRRVRAWRSGEARFVRLDVADRVLLGTGRQWWEVWEPEKFPRVAAMWRGKRPEKVAA